MGIDVVLSEMHETGKAARILAGQAHGLDPASYVNQVAEALPESTCATKSGSVAEVWHRRWRSWSAEMSDYGDSVLAARAEYQRNEDAAARDLHEVEPHSGRIVPR